MKDSGTQVVYMHAILRHVKPEIIAFAKRHTRLDAAAGEPHRERVCKRPSTSLTVSRMGEIYLGSFGKPCGGHRAPATNSRRQIEYVWRERSTHGPNLGKGR